MQTITVGLAPRKTSFYDPLTNTYITLAEPVQKITFDETAPSTMAKIANAILGKQPALVLYEGNLPQATIDAWTEKWTSLLKTKPRYERKLDGQLAFVDGKTGALDRAADLSAGNNDMPNAMSVEAVDEPVVAAAVAAEVEAPKEAPKTTQRKGKASAPATEETE